MCSLPQQLRTDPSVAHALHTVEAAQSKNYYAFGKLYESAPNLGKLFMESMLGFIRGAILKIVSKAYVVYDTMCNQH